MAANPIGVQAGGNISPARLVVMSTTLAFTVVQATGTSTPFFGVADEALLQPPNTPADSGWAAQSGFPFRVFQDGEEANVEVGSNSVSVGDLITSDANGRGITATSATYNVGQALEPATASLQRIRVRIEPSLTKT